MKLLKYTKRLLQDKDIKIIILLFLIWRISLFLAAIFAINFIPLRGKDFFGGSFETYLNAPWFFGWANFDGEHYLSIASIGYRGLEQAFFPVYPILMNLLAWPFGKDTITLIFSGLFISNLSLLLSLIILWKLIILDYSKNIARLTILLILVFPTSFYFGALYSESLFLLLTVASFYLIRKNRWFWATLLGVFSSGARIFGMLLTPTFLIECWQRKINFHKFFWIFFIPLGLLGYMYYQWMTVGDPIAFYNLQKLVGPQHESGITLLPQIYFRYIKMLLTIPFSNPIYQTIVLEFFAGILFFILPLYGLFKKMRYSYVFYTLIGFLLPTIQGSFSSVPRYVIVFFPGFIVLAMLLNNMKPPVRAIILIFSAIWLVLETAIFIRGYWVA